MKNILLLIPISAFLLCWNVSFAQIQTQTFLSSGTFTVPPNVYAINVSAWGSGGGGGRQDDVNSRGGGGGGGGAFASGALIVTPGSTINIVVGTGGLGGGASDTPGGDGAVSSAIHVSGSIAADGGVGGTAADTGGAGGAGGTFMGAVINQVSFAGGTGGAGDDDEGGGGGGGAGNSAVGGDGANLTAGTGGNVNGGDGGVGGDDEAGADGSTFGGGGGGSGDTGMSLSGGDGANGGVILTWVLTSTRSISQTDSYSSNTNFTVPAGVTSLDVDVWGGGGGGGQQGSSGAVSRGGGGGGGGAFAGGTLTVSSGDNVAIVIGSGGAGATNDGDTGADGISSSATHSSGSITVDGGSGGEGTDAGTGGAAGAGYTTTGTVDNQTLVSGGIGGNGSDEEGGGGGGGAGDSGSGVAGDTPAAGTGGNANGGNGGAGGSTGAGANGSAPGGGGGGAGEDGGGGGDGGDGFVSITYTCATITLSSAEGTQAQTINNSSLDNITYTLSAGITGATVAGLPAGVTSSFSSGTLTISGVPTDVGFAAYAITTTAAACDTPPSLGGFINVEVVLPVDLLSFDAAAVNEGVKLNWVTAKEVSNEKFIIEYSTDGKFFTAIGEVRGLGDSDEQQTYQFVDNKPVAGINYYRLKQMDYDGQFEYSNIETVYFDGKKVEVSLYPNPTDGLLSITTSSVSSAAISIFDSKGTLLRKENFDTAASMDVNLSDLPSGAYILSIQTEGQVYQEKFMKL